jgi:ParB family chromosome partitioning protein
MNVDELPISQLRPAVWNSNEVEPEMMARLRESMTRFGLVENLVARPNGDGTYEVLSGNHRFQVLIELGVETVPCVVVDLDDAQARLLAQAMNHIRGEDNPGLRAEVLRQVLDSVPQYEVLRLLPETADGLQALVNLCEEDLATQLEAWQHAQAARLKLLQFRLTDTQSRLVHKAIDIAFQHHAEDLTGLPNARGAALYRICEDYLGTEDQPL